MNQLNFIQILFPNKTIGCKIGNKELQLDLPEGEYKINVYEEDNRIYVLLRNFGLHFVYFAEFCGSRLCDSISFTGGELSETLSRSGYDNHLRDCPARELVRIMQDYIE